MPDTLASMLGLFSSFSTSTARPVFSDTKKSLRAFGIRPEAGGVILQKGDGKHLEVCQAAVAVAAEHEKQDSNAHALRSGMTDHLSSEELWSKSIGNAIRVKTRASRRMKGA